MRLNGCTVEEVKAHAIAQYKSLERKYDKMIHRDEATPAQKLDVLRKQQAIIDMLTERQEQMDLTIDLPAIPRRPVE